MLSAAALLGEVAEPAGRVPADVPLPRPLRRFWMVQQATILRDEQEDDGSFGYFSNN